MHTMSQYLNKDDMITGLQAENEKLRKMLENVCGIADSWCLTPSDDLDEAMAFIGMKSHLDP